MTPPPPSDDQLDSAGSGSGSTLPDPVAARLQARVEEIEAQPSQVAPRRRARPTVAAPAAGGAVAGEDIDKQLDRLRRRLETAVHDIEGRLAAAEARTTAAESLARSADTRAQVAAARTANVLYAIDDLAHELKQIAGSDEETAERIGEAVDRLRARVNPASAPRKPRA